MLSAAFSLFLDLFQLILSRKASFCLTCYAVPFVSIYNVGQVMPVEVTELPLLEKLCLEHNKLSVLPPEIGKLKNLKILRVDNNMLISVPGECNLAIPYTC